MDDCLFCKIVRGAERSWTVWETETHIAFLTPFPNTLGFTVVASKEHLPSDIFALDTTELYKMIDAAKAVSVLLNRTLKTSRTAMIAEGMGIDHAHVKLIPLHGLAKGGWKPVLSTERVFFETYQGYVSSHDGPYIGESVLDKVAGMIRSGGSE